MSGSLGKTSRRPANPVRPTALTVRVCAPGTAPVKSYGANGFGLYDMAGHVWEWVTDWYRDDYRLSSSIDRSGPSSGERQVLREGS